MADYDYLPVSGGSGDAILMHITADRAIGATTIAVDSVVNVPTKFIGTTGTLLASGFIDISTKTDFKGHVDTGSLIIDAIEPGSTDIGNTSGQIVIIKPNTGWANRVASHIKNITGLGTPENSTINQLSITTPSIKDANGNVIFALDGWTSAAEAWTYASATTITVPSDATLKYGLGDVVKFTQSSTVKRGVITRVTSTVLTVSMLAGATVANSAITANFYSKSTPGTTLAGAAPFNPYKFFVYLNTGGQGRQNAIVPFDTKVFDTGSNVDIVTNKGRFTAPVAGFYQFSSTITSGTLSSNGFGIALKKNGSEYVSGNQFVDTYTTGARPLSNSVSALIQLAAGDYVEVYDPYAPVVAYFTGTINTFFSGYLVSLA